jgi:hypothetical protein
METYYYYGIFKKKYYTYIVDTPSRGRHPRISR